MGSPIVLSAVILIATALLMKTAVAGLGWTLEDCKQHYGEPIKTESHALGLKKFTFVVKDFYIVVQMDKTGKVGYISYTRTAMATLCSHFRRKSLIIKHCLAWIRTMTK